MDSDVFGQGAIKVLIHENFFFPGRAAFNVEG
jgi:hypothetical protein